MPVSVSLLPSPLIVQSNAFVAVKISARLLLPVNVRVSTMSVTVTAMLWVSERLPSLAVTMTS